LQTPTPNAQFTRRLYSVHAARSQRAHGALEDPQRCHSVLSNTLCKRQAAAFVLSMPKINAATRRSRRLHSVSTAFAQRCWRLHSAHLGVLQFFKTLWERCKDATLVWQGFYTQSRLSQSEDWLFCVSLVTCPLPMFDVTCSPAFVGASDVISCVSNSPHLLRTQCQTRCYFCAFSHSGKLCMFHYFVQTVIKKNAVL